MRRDESANAFQLNDSHSLYLLGQRSLSPSFQRYYQLIEKCAKEGEFLSFETDSEWLSCYAKDSQSIHSRLPLLVFQPHTVANITPFIQICHQMDIPVTTRGGGTGLAGCCVPSKEGVVLLTSHLKQMRNYDAKRGLINVEPGVTIRQLNRHVKLDGWRFPLAMTSEGVAGIAGSLSCNSRGYHQQQQSIYNAIDHVLLIDGQGQLLEVPSALVCGAEGLWGVIIELKVQLKKIPFQQKEFLYAGSWQDLLTQLPSLRSIHTLTFVTWFQDCFYLGLEGESWRLLSTATYLAKCLPGIQPTEISSLTSKFFIPSRQNFVVISSAFHSHQLPEACAWSLEQAEILQLECLQQADLLAGSLHLILQTEENQYAFTQKIEQFLVLWADFVDRQQGFLTSCHGVGMQMRPYMTPFWTEDSQSVWRNLQRIFDPKNLFGQERFFPAMGKSLEKVRSI